MALDDRKITILKAIIDSYIGNGEAVGSRTISKNLVLGISPATIRNEMSDLEDMGFLVQPHTSSGRIPTDKAYRYYVDALKKTIRNDGQLQQLESVQRAVMEEVEQLDRILKNSVRMLSQFTKYTSFIIAPSMKKNIINRIQIIPVDKFRVLMIIILDSNIVKQCMVKIRKPIPDNQTAKISEILTNKLKGYRLEEIDEKLKSELIDNIYQIKDEAYESIYEILPYLINQATNLDDIKIYSEGVENILDYPEYSDPVKAKEFMSFMADNDNVSKLLMDLSDNSYKNVENDEDFNFVNGEEIKGKDVTVKIGHENIVEQLKDCSLITATYKFNGKVIGKLGVIGPTRMDYESVIRAVKSMSDVMDGMINKNFSKDDEE